MFMCEMLAASGQSQSLMTAMVNPSSLQPQSSSLPIPKSLLMVRMYS